MKYVTAENFSTGLLLNSLSSILSYNHFNMDQMFGQGTDQKKVTAKKTTHQTSFLKQIIYFVLMLIMNLV